MKRQEGEMLPHTATFSTFLQALVHLGLDKLVWARLPPGTERQTALPCHVHVAFLALVDRQPSGICNQVGTSASLSLAAGTFLGRLVFEPVSGA